MSFEPIYFNAETQGTTYPIEVHLVQSNLSKDYFFLGTFQPPTNLNSYYNKDYFHNRNQSNIKTVTLGSIIVDTEQDPQVDKKVAKIMIEKILDSIKNETFKAKLLGKTLVIYTNGNTPLTAGIF